MITGGFQVPSRIVSFDNALLALEIEDLKLEEFDLSLTGFDLDELSALEALGNSTEEGLTHEDETPRPRLSNR